MLSWTLDEVKLTLKNEWKIARSSIKEKTNFIVKVEKGEWVGRGEVAFSKRYDESKESIQKGFDKFIDAMPASVHSMESLVDFFEGLDLPNSLKFGIESAFIHYLAALSEKNVNELLGIRSLNAVNTSISLPIMEVGEIKNYINDNNLCRFSSLKMKVDNSCAKDMFNEAVKYFTGRIRIDANESFTEVSDVLKFLSSVDCSRIDFLEQPMPATSHDGYLELKKNVDIELIADESITSENITSYYTDRFHGVNIKLMKSGGYLKALYQLRAAKKLGLKTMLGCMVETSLGISSAMNISSSIDYIDLDGSLLLKDDPYNLVSEEQGRLFLSHMQ